MLDIASRTGGTLDEFQGSIRSFVALPASTNRTFERSPAKVDGPSISQLLNLQSRFCRQGTPALLGFIGIIVVGCHAALAQSRGPSKLGNRMRDRTAQNGQPRAQSLSAQGGPRTTVRALARRLGGCAAPQ